MWISKFYSKVFDCSLLDLEAGQCIRNVLERVYGDYYGPYLGFSLFFVGSQGWIMHC